ncbi:MAG TPA: CoA-transferase [Candidatus Methylomirabilis sp.]|nr:CoA-transferase [Candidatus Methylomirabilis sp.]
MQCKLMELSDAARLVTSGSSIAIGGSIIRRSPVAFVRELIRLGVKDLRVLAFPAGLTTDMLAGVGALRRVEAVYEGLFQFGMSFNFRRGVEAGKIEVGDFPETAMIARFRAAAQGVSFSPTRVLLGTGMAAHNPEQIREITCPFTGEKYHAVEAAVSDFTVIHGYTGDEYGNVQWPVQRDSDDIDSIIAKAARRLIVTVEKIVPHAEILRQPTLTYIPHRWVEAIVEVPFGAHPGSCDGYYDEDDEHMLYYQECSKTPGRFKEYADKYIYGVKDHWDYLQKAVPAKRLFTLSVR